MALSVDRRLIYDLGLHEGHDTRYYLDKGFRVVALDANPRFCEMGRASFANKDCVVVERALYSEANSEVTFYVRDDSDGWSSVFQGVAERDGRSSTTVRVKTTTLSELFEAYGVPYYVKCDIEGADTIFASQLVGDGRLPPFVSVEIDSLEVPEKLRAAGYDRFQIVNQAHLSLYRSPKPAREGRYVPITFHGKMSGPFGRELPRRRWVTFEQAAAQFRTYEALPKLSWLRRKVLRRWGKLTHRGWLIGQSWLDLHATTVAELARTADLPCRD
ncbi:Methyltransferase FkbM [Rhodopseudomonas palustris BisB5]|uniref:Methyltransferase FkbM n=1 Tax=Rhodopseudomonas palustris (strain BisB5) TaxID=316057 RepID=Q137J8_RHOPS|nr:Methyltransferase FkbM [Rhodopseudomonas palustris BisB5]